MKHNDQQDSDVTDLKKLPMLGYHEERRSFPRIDYRTEVIISSAGKVLGGTIRTLSAEGLQIRCTPKTARILHPRGTHIAPGQGPGVMVRFELMQRGTPKTFVAEGVLTYITPRSQDEIAFGVHFKRISRQDKKLLAGFIVDSMRPK